VPKLPRITATQIISVLLQQGFVCVRQSGSHKIFKNADGKRVTVPFHGSNTLHPKLVKSILDDAEIDPNDLV